MDNIITDAVFQMIQLQGEVSWETAFTYSDDSDKYFRVLV